MGRVWFYVLRFSCSHSPVRRILRYAVCGLAERFSQRKPTLIHRSVYCISCGFAIVFICNIEKISGGFACKTHKSACRRAWQARLLAQSGVGCKFLVKHRQNQVVQALLVHGKLQMVLGADGTLAGRHPEDIPGKAHGRGLGAAYQRRDFVFAQPDGSPMHPDSLNTWLSRFCKRHGLRHLNPHSFRHGNLTFLISEGIDVVTASHRAGHSRPSTTANIYAHPLEKRNRECAELIGQAMKKQA